MGIPNISDEIEVDAGVSKKTFAPRKTFENFRNQMFMREPEIRSGINDLYKKGTFGEPGLELTKEKAIKSYKEYLKFFTEQKNAPLSQLAEEFGVEQVYGTQGKFASGGMAANGGRIGFAGGSRFGKVLYGLDYLIDLLKKKTITVKRGESGTRGTSNADSISDYRGKYYTPEGGGFETPAADARYYSKLGGDEGSPKVLTAELTPEEIEEGLRLRGLDLQDPEIGDIILPKSAEDKVKIDYLNTIRAKLEKYLKMAEGGFIEN